MYWTLALQEFIERTRYLHLLTHILTGLLEGHPRQKMLRVVKGKAPKERGICRMIRSSYRHAERAAQAEAGKWRLVSEQQITLQRELRRERHSRSRQAEEFEFHSLR